MVFIVRTLFVVGNIICFIVNTLVNWFLPRKPPTYPPIQDALLLKSVGELVVELRQRKITSEQLVQAYITRIQAVNESLNAVLDHRFEQAIKEAQHADSLIAKTNDEQLIALFRRYPLLGIPFTVKESAGVKGLSFVVGNIHRMNVKCERDNEIVERLRSAGCIPLLVSANPELCMSYETNTIMNGKCRNPYDLNRVSGGSSGGEGALNGAGASLFGFGSDIGGSIRLPSMFCGVYGHKPTGGFLSVKGSFPYSDDPNFAQFLASGPITRFARDLPILLQVMAGEDVKKLRFDEPVPLKNIKIYYAHSFDGLAALLHQPTDHAIQVAIIRAAKYFEKCGVTTEHIKLDKFVHAREIGLRALTELKGIPSITNLAEPKIETLFWQLILSLFGRSPHNRDAIFMELMSMKKSYISDGKAKEFHAEREVVRAELVKMLGDNGVLFLPTFPTSAFAFHTSTFNLVGVDLMLMFNILGFPATHVPMGLDHRGLPIGFQVVAAPYQDKLCLQIAGELEAAFGGWVPPLKHDIKT
ncbi:fatty-acid amide hydrolase 2 [Zeugodacus cucurbitae]|uniref:fatty-acid amide hydrolase 2 n=1 Tax=Zeugodacus cucurbitae TaxID=28588 RepID=UPI0023D935A3|nr:fatty-acid amide hydrolase 2 [Zeugodacus cucurbitae]XP_054091312.1 fatty-acid amide hydrolase 2 [Zeugodacus cucurbitae]